jgi:hypothetical protein
MVKTDPSQIFVKSFGFDWRQVQGNWFKTSVVKMFACLRCQDKNANILPFD